MCKSAVFTAVCAKDLACKMPSAMDTIQLKSMVEHYGIVTLARDLQALTQPRSEYKNLLIYKEVGAVMKAELDQANLYLVED